MLLNTIRTLPKTQGHVAPVDARRDRRAISAGRSGESRQSKLLFREKIMLDEAFIYVKKMLSAAHPSFTRPGRVQSPTCRLCFLAGFTNDRVRFEEPAWQLFNFGGPEPMHILKLALPLAGFLMAGQALAHKASHASTTAGAPTRAAASRIDTNPAALLDEVSGRGVHGTAEMPGMGPVQGPAKNNAVSARINPRH